MDLFENNEPIPEEEVLTAEDCAGIPEDIPQEPAPVEEPVVVKEPVVPEIIKHVSVELNGYQYKEPKQFFHQFK